jgi:hypothetical protein
LDDERIKPYPQFPRSLANISVSGNVIKMRGAVSTEMVGDTPPANVVFSGNTY